MNPIIKEKWLSALRSGNYKQGKRCLHNKDTDTYCCLGVLCDIAVKEKVIPPPIEYVHGESALDSYGKSDEIDSAFLLPESIVKWSGIPRGGFIMNPANKQVVMYELTSMNDNGIPFKKIADIIEEYL